MRTLPLWAASFLAPLLAASLLPPPLAAARAIAPQEGAKSRTPQAKLSRNDFDFGTVVAGTAPSADLTIENVGDAPLNITRVGVTCECAKLHLSTTTRLNVPIDSGDEGRVALTLEPGDVATLRMTVDTSKLPGGLFEKKLLVVCNDPKNGAISLPFKVMVERALPPAAPGEAHGEHDGHDHAAESGGREVAGRAAAPPVDPALAPKLEADLYKAEFGTVYRGEVLKKTFELKNNGKSDLTLQEIRNTCSCAASKLTIDGRTFVEDELRDTKRLGILSPGETAELEVELKTAAATTPGKDQLLSKAIRVFSNDPARPVLTLTVEANMTSPFTVEPATIDFGIVRKGGGGKRSATIWSDQLGEFKVTSAKSPNPELMTVSLARVATEPGAPPTWRIDAEVSAAAPMGAFGSHVELAVDHERVKEILIPVHFSVEPNVTFTDNKPDRGELLDFDVMVPGTSKTVELTIENGDPTTPYLLRSAALGNVRPAPDGFVAEVVEVEKGMKYVVKLTAPATLTKASYFQGDLVLTADHPDVPTRKVRFRGWFKAAEKSSQ
ncbi:MAG: DUF1573 domain-containing protein [Planctomycetes bacterium]|nr:DUF1573 domain-containing protein [Planctomycetota bacterium]